MIHDDFSPQPEKNDVAPAAPVDNRSLAIGVLSITACVLLVGYVLVTLLPVPSYAIGQNDRAGDYIVATQQLTNTTEGLVVIDSATQRMIVYGYNFTTRQLVPIDFIRLDILPGAKRNDQPVTNPPGKP